MSNKSRLVVVNAEKFRQIRKSLGLSQVELSRRSGYSERVVRKAESGGVLRRQTLVELAIAMSTELAIVAMIDLEQSC